MERRPGTVRSRSCDRWSAARHPQGYSDNKTLVKLAVFYWPTLTSANSWAVGGSPPPFPQSALQLDGKVLRGTAAVRSSSCQKVTSQRDPTGQVQTPNTGSDYPDWCQAAVAINRNNNAAARHYITLHHLDKCEENNESIHFNFRTESCLRKTLTAHINVKLMGCFKHMERNMNKRKLTFRQLHFKECRLLFSSTLT